MYLYTRLEAHRKQEQERMRFSPAVYVTQRPKWPYRARGTDAGRSSPTKMVLVSFFLAQNASRWTESNNACEAWECRAEPSSAGFVGDHVTGVII